MDERNRFLILRDAVARRAADALIPVPEDERSAALRERVETAHAAASEPGQTAGELEYAAASFEYEAALARHCQDAIENAMIERHRGERPTRTLREHAVAGLREVERGVGALPWQSVDELGNDRSFAAYVERMIVLDHHPFANAADAMFEAVRIYADRIDRMGRADAERHSKNAKQQVEDVA